MGMYATASLWYGVYGPVGETLRRTIEITNLDGNEYVLDGQHIDFIHVGDNEVGVGGITAHNYCGDKTEFDVVDALRTQDAVKKAFRENGESTDNLRWYLTANLG